MARIVAHVPDLLFGSKVEGMLTSAGHEVEVIALQPGEDPTRAAKQAAARASIVVAAGGDGTVNGAR